MPKSFVLLTAMPPTKGHLALIHYARHLTNEVVVLVCTQPGEPFPLERTGAIQKAMAGHPSVNVVPFHRKIQQEPDPHNPFPFWNMWKTWLECYGFNEGDYIVSSEMYGIELAEAVGGVFMPYDLDRFMLPARATDVRKEMVHYQDYILPEFIPYLRNTVTFFGAESVGKTYMTEHFSKVFGGTPLHEWARPYLEAVGPEVTVERLQRIHQGQKALQRLGDSMKSTIYTFQDTDLYSTLGYWEMFDKESVPSSLRKDAWEGKSDLYVVLSSDIPFEEDPLRFGGDKRETSDKYWIDLCEKENLPYVYIQGREGRAESAHKAINEYFNHNPLSYQRVGKQYERGV